MADDLKPRSIKIGEEMWRRWQADASVASVSLTALIVQRMEGQASGPDLADLSEVTNQIIRAKDAEIVALKDRVALLENTRDEANGLCANAIAVSERAHARIAELEKAVATAQSSFSHEKALALMRGDPAMKAIDPTRHHPTGPVLSSAVPTAVRGDAKPFFKPSQRAALDALGEAPPKAKGKDKR